MRVWEANGGSTASERGDVGLVRGTLLLDSQVKVAHEAQSVGPGSCLSCVLFKSVQFPILGTCCSGTRRSLRMFRAGWVEVTCRREGMSHGAQAQVALKRPLLCLPSDTRQLLPVQGLLLLGPVAERGLTVPWLSHWEGERAACSQGARKGSGPGRSQASLGSVSCRWPQGTRGLPCAQGCSLCLAPLPWTASGHCPEGESSSAAHRPSSSGPKAPPGFEDCPPAAGITRALCVSRERRATCPSVPVQAWAPWRHTRVPAAPGLLAPWRLTT